MSASYHEPAPINDNIDFDMVIKVLSQTAFSSSPYYNLFLLVDIDQFVTCLGPFFTCFIPIFYVFQGYELTDPVVLVSSLYCAAVSAFCTS